MTDDLAGGGLRPAAGRAGDPRWMLILRAVALVLAIVLMMLLLLGLVSVWQRTQQVGDLFDDDDASTSSTTEPAEEFTPAPGAGQTEESLDWYQTNDDGSESYCYTIPDPYEEICEPTGN